MLTSATLGCASALPPTLEPELPPTLAPELRRALQDTASATRVYTAAEVADPVISGPNNRPPSFLRARDGQAMLRFVVDTSGRVERATVELEAGSEPSIALRTVHMLTTWRYLPARLTDGRHVRQLAELTVTKTGNSISILLSTDQP